MPSGAKKRKAAKKKKEQGINNSSTSTNNPLGENELKSIDEKGSDGDSPAYRDNDDHNQFNEGSEEVEDIDPSAAVVKSSEEVRSDGKIDEAEGEKKEVVDVIEWDMKSDESCENKNVSVVHIESAKESDYGNGNSGGSNDETETGTVKNSNDESYDSSVKKVPAFDVVDSVKVKESVNSVAESSADSVNAVTYVSETQSGVSGNVLLEKSLASGVAETDLAVKRNEDVRTSTVEEPETREINGKVSSSVSQSPIPTSTNGAEHVKDSNTAECSHNQPPVAPAPLIVRKASWLNCCGLFEVLSSSDR